MAEAAGGAAEPGLEAAFAREARLGVQLGILGRGVCFALLWASFYDNAHGYFSNPLLQYRSALVALALALSAANWLVARRTRHPVGWSYPFIAADFVVAAALVFGWVPEIIADYPQYLAVRFQDVLFFVLVLGFAVLPLARRLPVVAAGMAALAWCAGLARSFLAAPEGVTDWQLPPGPDAADWLARFSRPEVLQLDYVVLQLAGLLALGLLLAAAVAAARGSVLAEVRAERERDLLARFFPPALLARLAAGDGRLAGQRRQVAVLFVDFDRGREAAASLDALGAHYAACERAIFAHGGIIDRFAGDPVMASFGALPTDPGAADPAAAALAAWRCAGALRASLAAGPLGCAGVGLAFGAAVVGEVGSARQRAFGVVGETTNLAARLLELARQRAAACVVQDALAALLPTAERAGLRSLGAVPVRGFATPLPLWATET